MDFFNTSNHSALYFKHRDHHGQYHWIVVMRVTRKINSDGSLSVITPSPDINIAEIPYGEINKTALTAESDIAPFKSKVDLVVNANAYAPMGNAVREFSVELTLRACDQPVNTPIYPIGLNQFMEPSSQAIREYESKLSIYKAKPYEAGKILMQSKLKVTGPRYWTFFTRAAQVFGWVDNITRLRMVNQNDWELTRPEPTTMVPLRYDLAYGGTVDLRDDEAPDSPPMSIGYPDNPVGSGFIPTVDQIKEQFDVGLVKANSLRTAYCRKIKKIKAPQITVPGESLKRIDEALSLAGWGIVAKHWDLRLKKAGTFDQYWIDNRCPLLPKDFDPNYWNGAHPDLQFDYLSESSVIELQNLVPHTRTTDQKIRIRLPGIKPEIEYLDDFHHESVRKPLKMDTVKIDLIENELTMLYRVSFKETTRVNYIHLHHEEIK
jgi:hypothetical protein